MCWFVDPIASHAALLTQGGQSPAPSSSHSSRLRWRAQSRHAVQNGNSAETPADILADLKSLTATDLKKFGQAFDLELAGAKPEILQVVQQWLESSGSIKPPGAKERANLEAQRFAGDLPERMRSFDDHLAGEVISRAELAAKELSKEGFEAFGKLLGISLNGSKPSMLKQLKNFVSRLAVNHVQTQF